MSIDVTDLNTLGAWFEANNPDLSFVAWVAGYFTTTPANISWDHAAGIMTIPGAVAGRGEEVCVVSQETVNVWCWKLGYAA